MITGNAYVDKAHKPHDERDLWSLSIDEDIKKVIPKKKKLSKKDVEIFKELINKSLNGTLEPDSKS